MRRYLFRQAFETWLELVSELPAASLGEADDASPAEDLGESAAAAKVRVFWKGSTCMNITFVFM